MCGHVFMVCVFVCMNVCVCAYVCVEGCRMKASQRGGVAAAGWGSGQ